MKRYALTALALTLTLALGLSFARADEAQTRGQAGDVLTPLAMGNTWVYANDDDDLITTDRIEGIVLFAGKPWHLLRTYERQRDQPAERNTSLDSDLWLAMIDGHECDAFTQVDEETDALQLTDISQYYRYPATLGETYQPNPDDDTMLMTVTALHEKVKTKAGEFDCIVYKETSTEDETYSFTSYLAPGVGIVKNTSVEEGETFTSELISYTLVEKDGRP